MRFAIASIKKYIKPSTVVVLLSVLFSTLSTYYCFIHGYLLLYGDSQSHLNIAKRVVSSITPGFSQLGGIWLPLPHLLMVPFVAIDSLWRTGLAGSIISGLSYVISCFIIYKLTELFTHHKEASFIAFLIFALNPNILYMQTTAMTELPLIMFMLLSIYFFMKFLFHTDTYLFLVFASLFSFCASLSRYDGWLLVLLEISILVFFFLVKKFQRVYWLGRLFLFLAPSLFGIVLWLLWDFLILGDPLYFINSPFSARAQQQGWLIRGELPTYHQLFQSFLYYSFTSLNNIGFFTTVLAVIGAGIFLITRVKKKNIFLLLLLSFPFLFYVLTLYDGQSIIFLPELVPKTFEWKLFNVRYGLMMVPFAAFFSAYYYSRVPKVAKSLFILVFVLQLLIYPIQKAKIITFEDGKNGLSSSHPIDPERFLVTHYDKGEILLDDYARTVSIQRSNLPMNNIIYIGNKPYWEESLLTPEKYATWIIMQKDDSVWDNLYSNPKSRARLFTYFSKVYTSPNILIFKRNHNVLAEKT